MIFQKTSILPGMTHPFDLTSFWVFNSLAINSNSSICDHVDILFLLQSTNSKRSREESPRDMALSWWPLSAVNALADEDEEECNEDWDKGLLEKWWNEGESPAIALQSGAFPIIAISGSYRAILYGRSTMSNIQIGTTHRFWSSFNSDSASHTQTLKSLQLH